MILSLIIILTTSATIDVDNMHKFDRRISPQDEIDQTTDEEDGSESSSKLSPISHGDEIIKLLDGPVSTQSELERILKDIIANPYDEHGNIRQGISIPLWETNYEHMLWGGGSSSSKVIDSSKKNVIVLDSKPLFRNSATSIYTWNNLVFKYHVHCESWLEPVDTNLVDYWFMRRLRDTGMVPLVYYISEPLNGQLVNSLSEKGKVKSPTCHSKKIEPIIRYIVMDKVDMSIESFVALSTPGKKELDILDAIRIGGKMIQLLERLHTFEEHLHHTNLYGYIHGDVHWGNFAFSQTGKELIMIDFGRAKIVNRDEINLNNFCTDKEDIRSMWKHPILSPWSILNCAPSFRDDVYRVIITVAYIMYGDAYYNYLDKMIKENVVQFVTDKLAGNIFNFPGTKFQLKNKLINNPEYVVEMVQMKLDGMIQKLLTVDIDQYPDYDDIKTVFMEIINLIADTEYGHFDDAFSLSASED